ncbi:MAG: polysaccharide deacetylase family protein [Hyphomicrobiaceae bacterium]
MHGSIGLVTMVVAVTATTAVLACTPNRPGKLQMGRTITIDTDGGATHGSVSYGETRLLRDKEVILTFDDGPIARRTTAILNALERHCVKATFFPVGRMAMSRPGVLRDTVGRGHTIGGHTWSHPNLRRIGFGRSRKEIQKGFAALEAIVGPRVAPLFRFPYLAESRRILAYVKSEDIASFSIDVDSGDTRGYGVSRVVRSTMTHLRRRGRGILLFHDSKLVTVRALPQILDRLANEGYRVVHLQTKSPHRAHPDLVARYRRQLDGTPAPVAEQRKSTERRRKAASARQRARRQRNQQPGWAINRTTSGWKDTVYDTER